MPVHDVAARGFGDAAEAYEQGRPTYPDAAIAWLAEHVGIRPGARVCDLGRRHRQAHPPARADRRDLARGGAGGRDAGRCSGAALPPSRVVAATAEALPFRDATLDAVVVAQAFHWFDSAASLAELHRVLRPRRRGSRLMWNAWDDSVPWVEQLHRVVADAGLDAGVATRSLARDWVGEAVAAHARWLRPGRRRGSSPTRRC